MAGLCDHPYLTPTSDSYFSWNRGKICNYNGDRIYRMSDNTPLLNYTKILTSRCIPQRGEYYKAGEGDVVGKPISCPIEEPLPYPNLIPEDEKKGKANPLSEVNTFQRCMNPDLNACLPHSEYLDSFCERFWRDSHSCPARDMRQFATDHPEYPKEASDYVGCAHPASKNGIRKSKCPIDKFVTNDIAGSNGVDSVKSSDTFDRCVRPDPRMTFPDSEYTMQYSSRPGHIPCFNIYGVVEEAYSPDTKTRHAKYERRQGRPTCGVRYESLPGGDRCCGSSAYEQRSSPLETLMVFDKGGNVVSRPVVVDHNESYRGYVPVAFKKQGELFGNRVADMRGYKLGNAIEYTHGKKYCSLSCPHELTPECVYFPKCCKMECGHCKSHKN